MKQARTKITKTSGAAILATLLAACGSASTDAVNPQTGNGVVVSVRPEVATVARQTQFAFQADVSGVTAPAVTWSIQEGSSCGSISSSGIYTAPAASGTCHVVATSVADTSSVGVAAIVVADSATAVLPLWVTPALSRVMKTDGVGSTRAAAIYAGRGEYESFQIALRGPLSGVNASPTDLSRAGGGGTIAASDITIYVERYQHIGVNTYRDYGSTTGYQPGPPGDYPDGLVPVKTSSGATNAAAVPFTVASGENQPLWVDVFVPSTTPAGTYTGHIDISSDQGNDSVPITLTVWKFTLPTTPSLKTAFKIRDNARRADPKFTQLLLQNRISLQRIDAAPAADLAARWGLNVTEADPLWANAGFNAPASVSAIQSAVSAYPGSLPLYVYTADEPVASTAGQFAGICAWTRNIHASGTRAQSLVTTYPQAGLLDDGAGRSCVDTWVMLPKQYVNYSTAIAAARARGEATWSYTDMNLDLYSPKWQIDYGLPDYRIFMGFMSWAVQATGVLYWGVDFWQDPSGAPKDPWKDPYWYQGPGAYPGEALLIYPGAQVGITDGPVPSIRLKWLRDGVEDYEYMAMLKAAGDASFVDSTVAGVATDWKTWSRDPATLDAARLALGRRLDGR